MKKIVYLSMIAAIAGFNFSANAMQDSESLSSLSLSDSASALSLSSSVRSLVAEAGQGAVTQACEVEVVDQQQQAVEMRSLALKNAGRNSCFLNSVMQAIYVCPTIRNLIETCGAGDSLIGSVQHFLTAMTSRPGVVSPVETGDRMEEGLTHDVLQYIPAGRGRNMAQNNNSGDALEVFKQIVGRLTDRLSPDVVGSALHRLTIVLTGLDMNNRDASLQTLLNDGLLGDRYVGGIEHLQDLMCTGNSFYPAGLVVDIVRQHGRGYVIPDDYLEVQAPDDSDSTVYGLRSVVVHTGAHFYTYQRVGEQWYKKDDAVSVIVDDDEAVRDMQKKGCICFYERVD